MELIDKDWRDLPDELDLTGHGWVIRHGVGKITLAQRFEIDGVLYEHSYKLPQWIIELVENGEKIAVTHLQNNLQRLLGLK